MHLCLSPMFNSLHLYLQEKGCLTYLQQLVWQQLAHKGKIKNIHSNEMKEENNPGIVILKFEVLEILAYDKEQIKRFGQTDRYASHTKHILYTYIQ